MSQVVREDGASTVGGGEGLRPGDSETLRAALEQADPGPLLMALVQLTGESGLLDSLAGNRVGAPPPGALVPRTELPADLAAEVRRRLFDLLTSTDQVSPAIDTPDPALFKRMVEATVGQEVADEFLPLLREQSGLSLAQPVVSRTKQPSPRLNVAVLGCGLTGIAAAISLARYGFSYEVFEAGDDVGGTWRVNRYPGVAVDTPSHYYSFSFEVNPEWSHYFPVGHEYQDYLRRVVEKYGVKEHIRFNSEVVAMHWDDAAGLWRLTVRGGDGSLSEATAAAVVTAAGFLNRPLVPRIEGQETFAGLSLHSTDCGEDFDVKGRRIGIIGAGCTSVQMVDALVDDVSHLTMFQRQPHWVRPNKNGIGEVPALEREALRRVPFYHQWFRLKAYWYMSDNLYPNVRVDRKWMASHELSISPQNDQVLQSCMGYIEEMFGDDPDLLRKMTPDFAPMGKRIIRDPGGYYPALRRPHVDVEDATIERIVPEGVVTADGRLIPLDVLVYATGFTLDFLSRIDIVGRDGVSLADLWKDQNPTAYLGVTVPGFPNLFITSGPNTSAGHGGGHNFMSETQVHYIVESLQLLVERGATSMEPTVRAYREHTARVDAQMEETVWRNTPNAHTYYRNAAGRVVLSWPFRMVDYWTLLRAPDEADYVLR